MEARTDNPTILVTGFEAFGDSEKNPTAEIVRLLDGGSVGDYRVSGVALPVTAGGAPEALREAVALRNPSLVLSLGLANGRSMLALERVAINVLDFPIPDNEGSQPAGKPVVEGGPAAYFATLPIKAVLAAWRAPRIHLQHRWDVRMQPDLLPLAAPLRRVRLPSWADPCPLPARAGGAC